MVGCMPCLSRCAWLRRGTRENVPNSPSEVGRLSSRIGTRGRFFTLSKTRARAGRTGRLRRRAEVAVARGDISPIRLDTTFSQPKRNAAELIHGGQTLRAADAENREVSYAVYISKRAAVAAIRAMPWPRSGPCPRNARPRCSRRYGRCRQRTTRHGNHAGGRGVGKTWPGA